MQAATVLKGAALVAGLMLKDHAKAMPEPMVEAVVSLHDNALLVGPRAYLLQQYCRALCRVPP